MKLSELKPNPNNPRIIKDDKFKQLCKSIKDFPKMMELRPIVVDKDKMILGGNMRFKALQEIGFTEIPDNWIKIADELTDDEKKRFIVEDNLPFGEWDFDALANQFEVEDLLEWGFDEKDLKIEMEVEEDDVPEVPEEAKSKLGEIYQLGEHRLMCGDATKTEDVEKLMDGQKADMMFTDPPYGIKYKDLKGRFEAIKNDMSPEDAFIVIRDSLAVFSNIPIYVCCNWKSYADIRLAMEESGLEVKACIVWDKQVRIQNLDKFYKRHEFILYSGLFGGQKTVDGDVWTCNRETRNDHPTSKPVELCAKAIKYSSDNESIVVDLFGGSGSTLIACEQLNRKCFMMELDPKYIDVIIKRWEQFTGNKAKKL